MQNSVYTYQNINQLHELIPENTGVFVVIDNNLKVYKEHFSNYKILSLELSETLKTLQSVEKIIEFLLENGADRDCFVLGVGGGIVTDVAGFAASIYKRGVRFGFVPTTLLAQVDASIGGKNGVNFDAYKNIIGVINQPQFVYECTQVLKTLPHKEFKAGISEVLKTFILFDAKMYDVAIAYFTELEEFFAKHNAYLTESGDLYKEEILTNIIDKCAKYKSGVVERDEFERGERRLLNLGHTFAHAIEKHDKSVMHGEAVSVGMVMAAQFANFLFPDKNSGGFAAKLKNDLEKVGLPVELPQGLSAEKIVAAITKDKKVFGESIHLILPFGLERVEDVLIPLKDIEEKVYDMHKC